MSFKFEISGKITRGHSLEALFNQFNNVVFSSSRKSVPTEACKDLFGGQIFKMKGITRRLLFQQMSEKTFCHELLTGPFDSNFKIGKSLT